MAKSILQKDENECYVCHSSIGVYYRHRHHVFGGYNRKWSEKYGMTVYLCPGCHNMDNESVHNDNGIGMQLKKEAQRIYESKHSREEFMQIFSKNYLWDEE